MYIDKKRFKSLNILDGKPVEIDAKSPLGAWMRDSVYDDENASHGEFLNVWMNARIKDIKSNLFSISEPIMKMAFENNERLQKVLLEEMLKPHCGACIMSDGLLYVYEVFDARGANTPLAEKEQCTWTAVLTIYGRDGKMINACFCANRIDHEGDGTRRMMFDSPTKNMAINYAMFSSFLILLAFLQYADTEKVYIENGQTKSLTRGESVKNSSGMKIKYYDSRWIREIIRTEGFKVRGHFRMQPYKINGEWSKKLIYINEFEKHGYHRRALKDV